MGGFTDTNVKLKPVQENGRAEYMMKQEEDGFTHFQEIKQDKRLL